MFTKRYRAHINTILTPSIINRCLEMERFVLIPQHLYKQKFKFGVKKLDTFEQKPVSVPTHLNPNNKKIDNKTRSLKNESSVDEILYSPRQNFFRWKRYRSSFRRFFFEIFEIKKKERCFPDIYYTILDATGINPQKVINKEAKNKDRGSSIPFKI